MCKNTDYAEQFTIFCIIFVVQKPNSKQKNYVSTVQIQ